MTWHTRIGVNTKEIAAVTTSGFSLKFTDLEFMTECRKRAEANDDTEKCKKCSLRYRCRTNVRLVKPKTIEIDVANAERRAMEQFYER